MSLIQKKNKNKKNELLCRKCNLIYWKMARPVTTNTLSAPLYFKIDIMLDFSGYYQSITMDNKSYTSM
jgi:hypothetical protein